MMPIAYYPTPDVQRTLQIQQTNSYKGASRSTEKAKDFRSILRAVDAIQQTRPQNGERHPSGAQQ